MNSDEFASVEPEEVLAYVDGEATERVADRIRTSPTLMALADEYTRIQSSLRRRLRRFDCPPSVSLGEYELDMLTVAERTRIASHVQDCPHCAGELRILRQFLGDRMPNPPIVASDRLRRIVAHLVSPPRFASAHWALRSAAGGSEMTFSTEEVSIVLASEPHTQEGRWILSGMIWHDEDDFSTLEGSTAALIAENASPQTTQIGAVGDFLFPGIPPGIYRLEVTLEDKVITVERLDLGR